MTPRGRVSSLRVQSHFHHTMTGGDGVSAHFCPKHTLFKELVLLQRTFLGEGLAAAWEPDQQAKSRDIMTSHQPGEP